MRRTAGLVALLTCLTILLHDAASGRLSVFRRTYNAADLGAMFFDSTRDHDRVSSLLRRGASINVAECVCGWSPLHEAVVCGYQESAEILIRAGIDVNSTDLLGNTPLHFVQDKAMANSLIGAGAQVDPRNREGKTSLHCAAEEGETDVVEVLLAAGARAGATDTSGATPLHWALNRRTIELLVESGADVRAKDDCGWTALHGVADPRLADALLGRGADIEARDLRGRTPLHTVGSWEPKQSAEHIVAFLIDKGANIGAKTRDGQTRLHEAAARGDCGVAGVLIANGAAVDARDKLGWTPLRIAADHGQFE